MMNTNQYEKGVAMNNLDSVPVKILLDELEAQNLSFDDSVRALFSAITTCMCLENVTQNEANEIFDYYKESTLLVLFKKRREWH